MYVGQGRNRLVPGPYLAGFTPLSVDQVEQILQKPQDDPYGIAYARWQPAFAELLNPLAFAADAGGPYYEFTVQSDSIL